MPQMQDKQLDELFRNSFADAEIEPSADLWANIEEKLAPKKKKVFPVFWLAAASVIVVLTAALVFQKEEKIQLRGKANLVAQKINENTKVAVSTDAVDVNKRNKVLIGVTKNNLTSAVSKTSIKVIEKEVVESNLKKLDIAMQPSDQNQHLPIKLTDVKPLDVLPKEEAIVDKQIMYAAAYVKKDNSSNVIGEADARNKRGIENVGDLVNLVVDRVDKRDKKLIQFSTDDDDNSSIIGINIGILKFNKKNKQ